MNVVYLIGVLVLLCGSEALLQDCETGSECSDDECCLSNIQPRGRKALSRGTCQIKGTDGSKCIVHELPTGIAGVFYDCPCASGYYCNGTGRMVINKGELGVCGPIVKTTSLTLDQPCSSGGDCAYNECCVSDVRPLGKRGKRQLDAHCRKMSVEGQGCLVKMGSGKPDHTVYACPCASGLTCHGSGFFDIPLGESGVCGV